MLQSFQAGQQHQDKHRQVITSMREYFYFTGQAGRTWRMTPLSLVTITMVKPNSAIPGKSSNAVMECSSQVNGASMAPTYHIFNSML
jgi:hypothetical protein